MPTLAELNGYTPARFSAAFGPVYEHSPWIAERAYARRPFASRADLHLALYGVVRTASEAEQVALIRAHPELAGREAQAGALTDASTREQAQAGLSALTPEEFADLGRLNADYAAKFGFPFVICARENKQASILAGFDARLGNSRDEEIATALGEIAKITRLRLLDIVRAE